jgi:hypothetical protein
MEVKPFGIYVSVAYPPDTDTPGYKAEMLSKPSLTARLSEAGSVFQPDKVAKDICRGSALGYFGIATGLDGWMLKQVHPGMSPVHNAWEVLIQILFSPLCRLISVFYLLYFDQMCMADKIESEACQPFKNVSEKKAAFVANSGSSERLSDSAASASASASAAASASGSGSPNTRRTSVSTDR